MLDTQGWPSAPDKFKHLWLFLFRPGHQRDVVTLTVFNTVCFLFLCPGFNSASMEVCFSCLNLVFGTGLVLHPLCPMNSCGPFKNPSVYISSSKALPTPNFHPKFSSQPLLSPSQEGMKVTWVELQNLGMMGGEMTGRKSALKAQSGLWEQTLFPLGKSRFVVTLRG